MIMGGSGNMKNFQCVNLLTHQILECAINHPVPVQQALVIESVGNDGDTDVTATGRI